MKLEPLKTVKNLRAPSINGDLCGSGSRTSLIRTIGKGAALNRFSCPASLFKKQILICEGLEDKHAQTRP